MTVSFLTSAQRESYGRYAAPPSPDELARFFHLSEDDQALILNRRADHNRLGFALQLTTVRFLGTFLEDSIAVPSEVVQTLSRQLGITKSEAIGEYRQGRWRRQHATEIRAQFGYRDFWQKSRPVAFNLASDTNPWEQRTQATEQASSDAPVRDVRWFNPASYWNAQRVNQNVALTSFDTLVRIKAAYAAALGGFYRLSVHDHHALYEKYYAKSHVAFGTFVGI
jgi:Domain of unknown function (DUF4158)